MRQIKFRAWDEGSKGMHPPMTITEIGLIMREQEPQSIDAVAFKFAFESLKWMQSTGLLDKSGTLIFESDILIDSQSFLWEVYWYEDHACFAVRSLSGPAVIAEIIDNVNMLVKANIHQNPELLKP